MTRKIIVLEGDDQAAGVLELLSSFSLAVDPQVEELPGYIEPGSNEDAVVLRRADSDWGSHAPNQVVVASPDPRDLENAVNRLVRYFPPAQSRQPKLVDARLRVAASPRGGKFFVQRDS